eukprot:s92_g55.t1
MSAYAESGASFRHRCLEVGLSEERFELLKERDERMKKLSSKITGLVITGDFEPAHSVVGVFTTMIEEAAPKYLPLSKCVSREQELLSQRVDKRIVVLEDQKLQVKNNAPDITADLSTDLKLQNAFIRRGIACEQANLY